MEIEEIMDIIDADEFTKIMIVCDLACMLPFISFTHLFSILQPLCTQLGLCIPSNHFQVAERALYLFYNQRFVALLGQNMNELPVFIGSIVQHCSWLEPSLTFLFDPQTHRRTANKMLVLTDMHPQLVSQCTRHIQPRLASLFQHGHRLFHSILFVSFARPLKRRNSSRRHGP
jgi:serine/threonine-protein phosphatase 2A regulatory subunit B'